MTKPDMLPPAQTGQAAEPAFSVVPIETMRKRSDFLATARGKRQHMPGFVLQARKRPTQDKDIARVGYTCTKKVGNAVARNRAKRRLRALARAVMPMHARSDHDYVLIGRAEITANYDFADMCRDLVRALSVVHPKQ